MKRKTAFLFLLFALPASAMAEEARLLAFTGAVEVRNSREGQWAPASADVQIAEGGAVRTAAGGSAVVLLPNKSKIWLKESTNLELEQRQTLASRLALMFGRIKVRVPHLLRREKFEVRTPSAVCAVRGTEFTVSADEAGKMDLNVLYGEVKMNFAVPPDKGSAEVYIPQGRTLSLEEKGKPAKMELMTAASERGSLENWNPGLKPEERQQELKARENDRAQVREFARVTSNSENSVKTFLNTVKEADLEAGRTLNDVHGNVVRVDQRLVRPDNSTLQFYNIVKRPVYNYKDSAAAAVSRGGFFYKGAASISDRLDLMQMTMKFNRDLPQRIEEWPSFFSGSDIHPEWASFISANRTYADEIFFTAEGYRYDAARGELVNNIKIVDPDAVVTNANDRDILIAGIIKNDPVGPSAIAGLNEISRLRVKDFGVAGQLVYTPDSPWSGKQVNGSVLWAGNTVNQNPGAGVNSYEKTGDPRLWQYQATAYAIGNNDALYGIFWYTRENYLIGNSGAIKGVGDLTNSSSDPFTLLKSIAGESIISIKDNSYGGGQANPLWSSNPASPNYVYNDIMQNQDYFSSAKYLTGTNIDLVFIPDLAIAAVQKMLPAITNLKN